MTDQNNEGNARGSYAGIVYWGLDNFKEGVKSTEIATA